MRLEFLAGGQAGGEERRVVAQTVQELAEERLVEAEPLVALDEPASEENPFSTKRS